MSNRKRITPSIPTQQANPAGRGLDWNLPKITRTPRSEYSFMRNYAMVLTQSPNGGSFGPFNGGVAQ
jgi:hypothetical protein